MGTLLTAAMLAALAQQTTLDLDLLRDVSLPDQYGTGHSLRENQGEVLLVLVVSAERLRSLKDWEEGLRKRLPELDTLRVADVVTDSPTTYDRVASKLKERVPEGVSILIDLERRFATELELDTGEPNLLVVNAAGELVAHYRGRRSPVLLELVVQRLEPLLSGS